jgi:hypothetical protein
MKIGALCALALGVSFTPARADSFGSGGNAFTIDFVNIGNAGNADDRARDNTNNTPGDPNDDEYATPYGGVPYAYRMGTLEISQDQITKATAGGLSGVTAGPWSGSQPAAAMTWYEAAAFVNWLNTSTGHQAAYNLTGVTSLTLWDGPTQAWQLGGENLYRHKNAYYFLPSEDEWYKAAFHKNDGVSANYWDYATGSNSIPTAVVSGTGNGTAVYNGVTVSPADVNFAGGLSAYGTMGQNGNVWEWQESAADGLNNSTSEDRVRRGGVWTDGENLLRSSIRDITTPVGSESGLGFRVASVPEPSSTVLMIGSGLILLARRRRERSL